MADPTDYISTLTQSVLDNETPDFSVTEDTPETERKRTISETFSDGMLQGSEGLAADVEYFKALSKTLVGSDEDSIADNIAEARRLEENASLAVQDIDTFGEFLEAPTVSGFFEQAVKFSGQAVPSLVTTVAGGGVGGVATVLGKKGVTYSSRKIAERIGRDSINRTIKGTATPDEKDLANSLYKTFKNGAIGGAFAAEYVPLSGSNLSEALDSGKELDTEQAARAGLLGLPQAAIGVAGEVAIVKLLGNVAKKRAVKESSTFGDFAKLVATNTLRTGAIEGATEVGQESLAVLNRMDLDPTYTAEDAQLRLAEAAFGGFFGGAPVGATGTVAATGIRKVAEAGVLDATADIMDKARRMMDEKRTKDINDVVDDEQYGDPLSSTTTPESQADLNAQLKAMVDPTSTKKSVWQAGTDPAFNARPNKVTPVTVDGKRAFAAFIPGRGTIISADKNIVQEVINSRATDSSLAIALGYNQSKTEAGPTDIVVQVFDTDGNVVSEEVTNQDVLQQTIENAEGLKPDGGSINITTAEQALETRAKKYQQEQGPEVREMDEDAFDSDQETDLENQEGVQTVEGEETVTGTYEPKVDRSRVFDNTLETRDDYDATFGAQEWDTAEIGEVSESTLREAVRQQRANKNAVVSIRKNNAGKFEVVRTSFDSNLIELVDPVDKKVYRVTEAEFLDRAVKIAKKSKFKNITLVTPDGRRVKVNLADLTRAGQRLAAARGDGQFEGQTPFDSAQKGLQEILADLQLAGYDVIVSGESILNLGNNPVPDYQGNVTAAVVDGAEVSLGDLTAPRQTVPEQRPEAVVAEDVDNEGRPTGEIAGRQSGTDAAMDAFERFQRDVMGRETRRVNQEFDPDDQVDETDGRSEVDRNLDQPETAQDADRQTDRRTGRAPTTNNQAEPTQPNRPQAEPEAVAGVEESFLVGLINNLRKAIKLKNPPRVFTYEKLVNMTMGEIEQQFGVENVNQVLAAINRMRGSNGNLRGMHLTLVDSGSEANLIILNESGNMLRDAAVLAHEFGHALFREEMAAATANPALRARLLKAFEKDPRYQNYLNAYDYELAFEEWYADQVARWATKKFINKQARSLTDKHFKELAQKLKAMYREFTRTMKRRLGNTSQDFETYIEAVVDAKKKGYETAGTSANPNFVQKAMVQEVNQAVVKMGGEALADHWRGKLADIARNPKLRPLMKLVRTADGIMRLHAGRKIADMFYIRSQDSNADGGLGFVGASARQIAEFQNKFETEVGEMSDPDVQAALLEAMSDRDTDQLSEKGQAVRKFLESVYDEYIAPSATDIGRVENYFPTALNLMAIQENLDGFVELVLQQDPTADEKSVRDSIQAVLKYNQSIADGQPIDVDASNPAAAVEKALQLTLNVGRQNLYDAGFLHEPQDAFVQYLRHVVKRVEWNKHTKDNQGNSILDQELDKLAPEDRAIAEEIIATHLGYQTNPLSPMWRKVNSYGQFLQFVTILPFAAIASLPEIAGPIINSKEFGGLVEGLKQIPTTIKNRAEARQFARDLGVVTNEVVANSWVTQAELDYMDPKVRKMSDVFFKYTALQWFTTFSREFAAGMGVQFILKHARNEFNNPRSERYLRELGLTAKEVMAWNDGGRKLTSPEGKKVKKGLQRFVESSILRPNSAERPVWASDPHWALVWQLKSYFYAYGKVIMGGVYREMIARRTEMDGQGMPQLTATLAVLALTALATMPLAMLAMEVREYTKQGLAAVLPGVEMDNKYFRTDRMDWPTYLTETIDRSGFLGIFTLAAMSHQNAKWDDKGIEGFAPDAILPFLGPTAETVDTILENGFSIDRTLKNRLIPIYNQL